MQIIQRTSGIFTRKSNNSKERVNVAQKTVYTVQCRLRSHPQEKSVVNGLKKGASDHF